MSNKIKPAETQKTHITMREIANLVGVSIATISRTLSTPEKVSLKTRHRVEEAINHAGYSVAQRPQLIQSNHANLILILVPAHYSGLFIESYHHLSVTAKTQGYTLLTINTDNPPTNALHYLMMTKEIGGLLLFGSEAIDTLEQHPYLTSLPKVLAYGFDPKLAMVCVNIDNLSAAFDAVNMLCELGHRRIACLSGPKQFNCYRDRQLGYLQALKRWGIAIESSYMIETDISFTGGARGLSQLFSLALPPTALLCHSDIQAIGALHQAKQLKLNLPQALSVIGFDNLAISKYSDPSLTTIDYCYNRLSEHALLLLIELMQGRRIATKCHQIEYHLIQRSSTIAYQR